MRAAAAPVLHADLPVLPIAQSARTIHPPTTFHCRPELFAPHWLCYFAIIAAREPMTMAAGVRVVVNAVGLPHNHMTDQFALSNLVSK